MDSQARLPDVSTPAGIFRLANAFCDAQALLTAVDLGLFTLLRDEPLTTHEITSRLDLHGRGVSDFLNLLASLGLLTLSDGRYANAPGAATFLIRGEMTYVGCFLEHARGVLYPVWDRLTEGLRTGEQQSSTDYHKLVENPELLRELVWLMDATTHFIGPALLNTIDWSGYSTMADIGGARGNVAGMIAKSTPSLRATVFDLPALRPLFEEHIGWYGVGDRVTFQAGDFFTDPLPSADILLLGHVLPDWDPVQRKELITKAYDAVNPGGALLVYDRMLDDTSPDVENLILSLDLTLVTRGGSQYPATTLVTLAVDAGFTTPQLHPITPKDTALLFPKPA
jgi:hypothetical protein